MNSDKVNPTQLLFEFYNAIDTFQLAIKKKFNLDDIPYNYVGKVFPSIGNIEINNKIIGYRWHGQGCTLFWNKIEIFFNVNPVIENSIIITIGGWYSFIESLFKLDLIDHEFLLKSDFYIDEFLRNKILDKASSGESIYSVNLDWYERLRYTQKFTITTP